MEGCFSLFSKNFFFKAFSGLFFFFLVIYWTGGDGGGEGGGMYVSTDADNGDRV